MDWTVDPNSDRPPSRQLVETVLDALARGTLSVNEQLPSVRGLATRAVINHNTVARAWRDLEQMGVAQGRNGRGVFITPKGPQIAREARVAATLIAFQQAARAALRTGHELADLERVLRTLHERKSA